MQEKPAWSHWAKSLLRLLQQFSQWHRGIGVVVFIFVLALITRTAGLSSFPYFPRNWPWNGVNGLYIDEYDISQVDLSGSTYFPFLQIILMGFVTNLLGYSTFSIRLVSALFSSVTCVLVYLSANELFHRKLAAFLSSMYFVFMVPAVVYGRTAFLENGAATFFVATFLFALKYLRTTRNIWLICAVVSAGLSFLCKQTGFVAVLFLVFLLLGYRSPSKSQLLKFLCIAGILASFYFIQIMIVNPSYLDKSITTYVYTFIGSVSWFSVFLFNLMPSGVNISWIKYPQTLFDLYGFVTLDFWYIFAFFLIFYLMVKERETVQPIILAILSYILVLVFIGHANDYYVILIQPFMAIPVGYGLLKLREMPSIFASAFALFLCFPAAAYIVYYTSYFLIPNPGGVGWVIVNIALATPFVILGAVTVLREEIEKRPVIVINRVLLAYYVGWLIIGTYVVPLFPDAAWIVLQFNLVDPIIIIGVTTFWNKEIRREETTVINRFLLVFYVVCLVVGSYVLPAFYPGYFAQTTVPT